MVVAAADAAAQMLGLFPGMPLTQAQAMVPGLVILEADPEGDAAVLGGLAGDCLRVAPLTAPDPPDGIWIDATGAAHLFGGEAALLADVVTRLGEAGFAARAAMADTPGAAHAAARHGDASALVVPPGETLPALATLSVAGLRLDPGSVAALRRLGFDRIGQLAAAPRAPLARRFPVALHRLDQALGRVPEPITPILPPEVIQHRIAFAEPLLTAEAFVTVIRRQVPMICAALERAGQGARRLDLHFERLDGLAPVISIGTARPARDPAHLARLLEERIETLNLGPGDPGLGIEAMRLVVSLAEPLAYAQETSALDAGGDHPGDIAVLVDRLANRFGAERVYRAVPVESDVPERAVRRVSPLAAPAGTIAPCLPRPTRLLTPPQRVEALAMLPDHPPASFIWRRVRHRVKRADGPERIAGEWWRRDGEIAAIRDYWAVEDEAGRRFWLYRSGNGTNPETGDLTWYLHGLF